MEYSTFVWLAINPMAPAASGLTKTEIKIEKMAKMCCETLERMFITSGYFNFWGDDDAK